MESNQLHDLGMLSTDNKIFISLLPKSSKAVVVNYTSGIRISCVIPPQKLKVRVSGDYGDPIRKCKIETPTILASIKYQDIPVYGNVEVESVSLFVIKTEIEDQIWLTPYLFANVYGDGRICWGTLDIPWDLKSACNTFWSSNFNEDLETDPSGVMRYIKRYRLSVLPKQSYTNQTDFICGQRFWAAPKGSDGILITSNAFLLKQIPSEFWIKTKDEQPKICLLANRQDDRWDFESGKYKFSLPREQVVHQPKFKKVVSNLKKKYKIAP